VSEVDSMNTVLFLCTGNYYRSRFAEYLFNFLAAKHGLDWQADSRGLAVSSNNIGPVSRYAVEALARQSIKLPENQRFPLALSEKDLQAATKVIALDESEHRQLMHYQFPEWTDTITYWLVHDIHLTSPEEALAEIDQKVRDLVDDLRKIDASGD